MKLPNNLAVQGCLGGIHKVKRSLSLPETRIVCIAALIGFFIKIFLSIYTYGTNDVSTWRIFSDYIFIDGGWGTIYQEYNKF